MNFNRHRHKFSKHLFILFYLIIITPNPQILFLYQHLILMCPFPLSHSLILFFSRSPYIEIIPVKKIVRPTAKKSAVANVSLLSVTARKPNENRVAVVPVKLMKSTLVQQHGTSSAQSPTTSATKTPPTIAKPTGTLIKITKPNPLAVRPTTTTTTNVVMMKDKIKQEVRRFTSVTVAKEAAAAAAPSAAATRKSFTIPKLTTKVIKCDIVPEGFELTGDVETIEYTEVYEDDDGGGGGVGGEVDMLLDDEDDETMTRPDDEDDFDDDDYHGDGGRKVVSTPKTKVAIQSHKYNVTTGTTSDMMNALNDSSNSSYKFEANSDVSQNDSIDRSVGGSKEFACRHCGKKYRWKSTLRRHERVECGGKAPLYECPYCMYKAKQHGNLGVHVRKHHPDMPELPKRRKGKGRKSDEHDD